MTRGLVHVLWRRLRIKWDASHTRRQLEWERRHVTRHADGNVSVHGASMRAVLKWYGRQNWPSEWPTGVEPEILPGGGWTWRQT